MAAPRWNFREEITAAEEEVMKRTDLRTKYFSFLRRHRAQIFDDSFQDQLRALYRKRHNGKQPKPPAQMLMALILKEFTQVSDANIIDLCVVDLRWRMVLDCWDSPKSPFSQGTLVDFRERVIRSGLDLVLFKRIDQLATARQEIPHDALPTRLRIGIDSRPLEGAGKVEDTINLLGHAARNVVRIAAAELKTSFASLCQQTLMKVLLAPSIKTGLDVEWADPQQKKKALTTLNQQVQGLMQWAEQATLHHLFSARLNNSLSLVRQIQAQNLEPWEGGVRVRRGVSSNRMVSVEDPDMRHGHKSRSKVFHGYKQHVVTDLDSKWIYAVAIQPGNRPDAECAKELLEDVRAIRSVPTIVQIDLAYASSSAVLLLEKNGTQIIRKPKASIRSQQGRFGKDSFTIDFRTHLVFCPNGQTKTFKEDKPVRFDAAACEQCPLRNQCVKPGSSKGRLLTIHLQDEHELELQSLMKTADYRAQVRTRSYVEHSLGRVSSRQGRKATYKRLRKNLFQLRMLATTINLEIWRKNLEDSEEASLKNAA